MTAAAVAALHRPVLDARVTVPPPESPPPIPVPAPRPSRAATAARPAGPVPAPSPPAQTDAPSATRPHQSPDAHDAANSPRPARRCDPPAPLRSLLQAASAQSEDAGPLASGGSVASLTVVAPSPAQPASLRALPPAQPSSPRALSSLRARALIWQPDRLQPQTLAQNEPGVTVVSDAAPVGVEPAIGPAVESASNVCPARASPSPAACDPWRARVPVHHRLGKRQQPLPVFGSQGCLGLGQ